MIYKNSIINKISISCLKQNSHLKNWRFGKKPASLLLILIT